MDPAIVCRDVVKLYRTRRALDGVSFEVHPARSSPCSGRTAPASRRRSRSSRPCSSRRRDTSRSPGIAYRPTRGSRAVRSASCRNASRCTRRSPRARTSPTSRRCRDLPGDRRGTAIARVLAARRARQPRRRADRQFSGGMARRLNFACGILHEPRVDPARRADRRSRSAGARANLRARAIARRRRARRSCTAPTSWRRPSAYAIGSC